MRDERARAVSSVSVMSEFWQACMQGDTFQSYESCELLGEIFMNHVRFPKLRRSPCYVVAARKGEGDVRPANVDAYFRFKFEKRRKQVQRFCHCCAGGEEERRGDVQTADAAEMLR